MKLLHWVKKENSGLFRTVAELAKYEERLGHQTALREPANNNTFYGFTTDDPDMHCIHSQINPAYYKDDIPKVLFLHGEPDYGMMTKVSTNAIMDFAPQVEAFITLNEKEGQIWNSFKKTHVIPKGIDLEKYKPIASNKKLKGSPSILYIEHWRQFRHPLHVFVALEKVYRKNTKMRFYPFGCPAGDRDFWLKIIRQNKYSFFCPGVFQFQKSSVDLINMCDMVISPVYPSYGRVSIEAKACNKPVIAYNTNPHADYKIEPYNIDAIVDSVIDCWDKKPNGQRKYAEDNLSAMDMAKAAVDIYRRYV